MKNYKEIEAAFDEKFIEDDMGSVRYKDEQELFGEKDNKFFLKQFLKSSIQTALEAVAIKEEHIQGVLGDDDYLEACGYNRGASEIKTNIRNFMGEEV
jgi:hypothetical protein